MWRETFQEKIKCFMKDLAWKPERNLQTIFKSCKLVNWLACCQQSVSTCVCRGDVGRVGGGVNLQVTGCGGVSGRTLGWKVKVRVGAVEEGLPPLAVREVGLRDPSGAGAGLGVQGAASHRQAILHVKTEQRETDRGGKSFLKCGKINPSWTPTLQVYGLWWWNTNVWPDVWQRLTYKKTICQQVTELLAN